MEVPKPTAPNGGFVPKGLGPGSEATLSLQESPGHQESGQPATSASQFRALGKKDFGFFVFGFFVFGFLGFLFLGFWVFCFRVLGF